MAENLRFVLVQKDLDKDRVCMYPDCVYFDKEADHYCNNACATDHYDYLRLNREARKSWFEK
jgi:hypothetical protein